MASAATVVHSENAGHGARERLASSARIRRGSRTDKDLGINHLVNLVAMASNLIAMAFNLMAKER